MDIMRSHFAALDRLPFKRGAYLQVVTAVASEVGSAPFGVGYSKILLMYLI
jgi:hypothetical protein